MTRTRLPLIAVALLVTLTGCNQGTDPNPGSAGIGAAPTTSADLGLGGAPADTDPSSGTSATPGAGPSSASPSGPTVTGFRTAYAWGVPGPTVQITNPTGATLPYLAEVRAADHPGDGYSRISFYFRGGTPSYRFGYVPEVTAEGSGEPLALPGNGVVGIWFQQATAHDEDGRSTITASAPTNLGYRNLRGYRFGGDFEGQITYGLGIQVAPGSDEVLPIRVLELVRSDGFHIVAFDVRHG
ncbi:MAG TPA: hypothetical protein VF174_04205 [Micromonosporaceae bacterium]